MGSFMDLLSRRDLVFSQCSETASKGTSNNGKKKGNVHILGVSINEGTPKSSISRWDFPYTSYWGTPMAMETSILGP